tara:strand:- start:21327 stop:21869 length:543 start_codon:yes stop_codon:yes gene_type:complete
MKRLGTLFFIGIAIFLSLSENVLAQTRQTPASQQFRLGERIIRISEPGELSDSVNVWGDVGSSGRYLIPKGTGLVKLLSYGFGPNTLRDGQTQIDWSKMRVEINIQEYDAENGGQNLTRFKYRFEDPFPEGMREFKLENNQTITVRVKRKPSFRDYLGVFASTVSAVASTIILLDRLGGR